MVVNISLAPGQFFFPSPQNNLPITFRDVLNIFRQNVSCISPRKQIPNQEAPAGHSGEGQPISNEQRREDMGDREGTEKRGQRHPHFVYFSTLPGADLGTLPVCVDSGTSFGKNFNFPNLSAWCQWFLIPKAKNAKGFFFFSFQNAACL